MMLSTIISTLTSLQAVNDDPPTPEPTSMEKLWTAIIGVFAKIWEVINTNVPLVVDFFATYWIFLLPFIFVLFFIPFKIFERLLGAVR